MMQYAPNWLWAAMSALGMHIFLFTINLDQFQHITKEASGQNVSAEV